MYPEINLLMLKFNYLNTIFLLNSDTLDDYDILENNIFTPHEYNINFYISVEFLTIFIYCPF